MIRVAKLSELLITKVLLDHCVVRGTSLNTSSNTLQIKLSFVKFILQNLDFGAVFGFFVNLFFSKRKFLLKLS